MQFSYHRAQDFSDAEGIFKAVFPHAEPRKLRWQWEDNPAGQQECFLARDDDSNLFVAAVSVLPFKVQIHGKQRLFGQMVDAMTLPEYRGKRLNTQLLHFALENINTKFEFLVIYPSPKAISQPLRSGFKEFGDLTNYSVPLSGASLGNKFPGPPLGRRVARALASPIVSCYLAAKTHRVDPSIRFEEVTREAIRVDREWETLTAYHPIIVPRTSQFMQWRFFDVPISTYQTLSVTSNNNSIGYIVIRHTEQSVEIIDFCVNADSQTLERTIANLIHWCRGRGFDSLHMQCSHSNYCINAFKRVGFMKGKYSTKIIMLPISEASQSISIDDFYLTRADSDWI